MNSSDAEAQQHPPSTMAFPATAPASIADSRGIDPPDEPGLTGQPTLPAPRTRASAPAVLPQLKRPAPPRAGATAARGVFVASPQGRLRRGGRRMPYRVPCRVRLVGGGGEVCTVVGETVNISTGGVSLQIAIDVQPGTWVETLVPHPNGDPLFLCGRVVHRRRVLAAGYEIGVETTSPADFA